MATKSTKVAVLGIRTGTSLLTHMLDLAGLSVGDKANLLSHDNLNRNLYGYYENCDVLSINCEILKEYNGEWNEPPLFPDNWWKDEYEEMEELRQRAMEIKPLLIKDPRLCLTWKFWDSLYDMKPILCNRDSEAVGRSLRAAQGIDNGKELWDYYVDSFKDNCDDLFIEVQFNDLLNKDKTIPIIKNIFKTYKLGHLYKPKAEEEIIKLIDTTIKHN